MIKKIFKKEKQRPHREIVGISVTYYLTFDGEEKVEYDSIKKRAIMEDVSKQGLKLTITPMLDEDLVKQVKKKDAFVFVRMILPTDNIPIDIKGIVKWMDNDNEYFPSVTVMGAEFINLSAEEKVLISRYMTKKKR